MQTDRDAQMVAWLGRIGAAGGEHVSELFGIYISTAYARLRSLKAGGLVEHYPLLHRQAGLYAATRSGLRWQGLGRLSVCRPTPATFTHIWQVATVAVALQRQLPGWQILGEREIRVHEADEKELIASAQVGRTETRPLLHRPDLALVSPSGSVAAVEIELSVKHPARLEKICRGWTRARHTAHVYYLAQPGPARRVRRAADAVRATDLITVLPLEDVAGIAARELAREEAREAPAAPASQQIALPASASQCLASLPPSPHDFLKRGRAAARVV
jgi:hypothetical protein